MPCTADQTRSQVTVWRMFLDQDGSEPTEEQALRQRFLHLSRERFGLVGIRGALLPDVAAKLQTIINACLSPRSAPRVPVAGGSHRRREGCRPALSGSATS